MSGNSPSGNASEDWKWMNTGQYKTFMINRGIPVEDEQPAHIIASNYGYETLERSNTATGLSLRTPHPHQTTHEYTRPAALTI